MCISNLRRPTGFGPAGSGPTGGTQNAVFVERLGAKLADLLANPPAPKKCKPGQDQVFDHREFANLVLVREVVSRVMADTAWIVCKRNWRAAPVTVSEGQELPKYVATWSLGFFLNQAV
ncbi:unnamed protein product [Polarella glacialis]|uniref:Uncharacterized protein n=1 Tax=Polarella glacialis TaxID=89957 RepID=A0A813FMC5_POLGL|nr:unnamed protein product [Polarella glacialis]